MKYFEKQMTGFCVTYLHNPLDCERCLSVMGTDDDDMEKIFMDYCSSHKSASDTLPFAVSERPLRNILSKTQEVSKKKETSSSAECSVKPVKELKRKSFSLISPQTCKLNAVISGKVRKAAKTPPQNQKKKERKAVLSSLKKTKNHSVKKQSSSTGKKNSGDKVPGKGTLKRKRWFLEQLRQKNDDYEDDLFEDQHFGHFQNLLEDESDNEEKYEGLKTPSFPYSISPRETTPEPEDRDCYSPTQLSISRKGAEEYQYRRNKRKKLSLSLPKEDVEEAATPNKKAEKPKTITQTLNEVNEVLNKHVALLERTRDPEEEEEDQYFSDLLKPS